MINKNLMNGMAAFGRAVAVGVAILLVAVLAWGCDEKVMSDKETSEPASEAQTQPKVGGTCDYQSYPGLAEILSLVKAEPQEAAGEAGVERFEIRFSFRPDGPIEQDWVKLSGETFLLTLPGGRLPDQEFLAKHGIMVGQMIPCLLKVITKGTCTPLIFTWPSEGE